ncbi:MAG: polyketide synthase dehydratase domain-containing protein, partial [Persicimonas sp.]
STSTGATPSLASKKQASTSTETLDPAVDTWLEDHCPTFTRPALPMTGIVDTLARAAAAATGESVTEIRDVSLENWLIVDGPTELRTEVEPVDNEPEWRQIALWAQLEDGEKRIARGQIKCGSDWAANAEPVAPIEDARQLDDPYEDGAVFHGPAFQLLVDGQISDQTGAASGTLDAAAGGVPIGQLHPALLDAALHIIPHDNLSRWSDAIEADTVAYPHSVEHLTLHGPTPTDGHIRTEVRLEPIEEGRERFPTFRMQFFDGDRLWCDMRLVEMLYPKGRIARGEPAARRAFLRDREFVAGLGLSRFEDDKTRLTLPELRKNDWFEGTIAAVYDVSGDLAEQTRQVVIKDHLAQRLEVHPSQIDVAADYQSATCAQRPGETFAVRVEQDGAMGFVVSDGSEA